MRTAAQCQQLFAHRCAKRVQMGHAQKERSGGRAWQAGWKSYRQEAERRRTQAKRQQCRSSTLGEDEEDAKIGSENLNGSVGSGCMGNRKGRLVSGYRRVPCSVRCMVRWRGFVRVCGGIAAFVSVAERRRKRQRKGCIGGGSDGPSSIGISGNIRPRRPLNPHHAP